MDVLVVLVDVNAAQWGKRVAHTNGKTEDTAAGSTAPPSLTFTSFVDQLIVFFNAFLILNKSNQLCVIGMDASHADFIWPSHMVHQSQHISATNGNSDIMTDNDTATSSTTSTTTKRKSSAHAAGSAASAAATSATTAASSSAANSHAHASIGVDDELIRQLHSFASRSASSSSASAAAAAAAASNTDTPHVSKMAGALSLGLCYLNRVHTHAASNPSTAKLRSRVLIFSLCPDESSAYVSMMNGIFSTQKQSISVDACVLAENDSLFLQQASHLTKGIYGRVPAQKQHALLQYLMFMYLSDPTSRNHLILPSQSQVDLRATCFCHQQMVNLGVVCPACLAIFCRSTPKCQVCGTRFAVLHQTPQPIMRPPTPQTAAGNISSAAAAAAASSK